MGLKDQSLGLTFIQENIQAFGGDPTRVTLLGEVFTYIKSFINVIILKINYMKMFQSAGAVCSHLHMFSPMSKGLFSNVVSQSGSGLHFWSINQEPKVQAIRFANSVGCNSNDTMEIKSCLKQLDVQQLIDAHHEMLVLNLKSHFIKPCDYILNVFM